MDESLPCQITFYEKGNGACPVQEFLSELPTKEQMAIGVAMLKLREQNMYAREPLVRHLTGKLWELRVRASRKCYRLIYICQDGGFVILHIFHKQRQKTPSSQLEIAQKRLLDLLHRL